MLPDLCKWLIIIFVYWKKKTENILLQKVNLFFVEILVIYTMVLQVKKYVLLYYNFYNYFKRITSKILGIKNFDFRSFSDLFSTIISCECLQVWMHVCELINWTK